MAEIHVEAKKKTNTVWLWVVLAVVIVAAIVYFAVRNRKVDNGNAANKPNQTSYIQIAGKSAALI
jgi:cytochrome c-type biogenesis protein CcmH/NrfF